MSDDPHRAVAAGALAETTAFATACLATDEPTAAIRSSVNAVARGLHLVSAAVLNDEDLSADTIDQLSGVVRKAQHTPIRTAGETDPLDPGHSQAAALLRLARVVGQRAHRDLTAVAGIDSAVLGFVSAVPGIFGGLAAELDAAERRSVPFGSCA